MPLLKLTVAQKLNYRKKAEKLGWALLGLAMFMDLIVIFPVTAFLLLFIIANRILSEKDGWKKAKEVGFHPFDWFAEYPLLLVPLFIELGLLIAIEFGADLGVYLSFQSALMSAFWPLAFFALGFLVFAGFCALAYWLIDSAEEIDVALLTASAAPRPNASAGLNSRLGLQSSFVPFSGRGYKLGGYISQASTQASVIDAPVGPDVCTTDSSSRPSTTLGAAAFSAIS